MRYKMLRTLNFIGILDKIIWQNSKLSWIGEYEIYSNIKRNAKNMKLSGNKAYID